ncbi:hypothetical protein [Rhodococcus qingshengii]|uniref:hypothetical protein n=1 Tax=Rhodococcus qingshengii TaxID=334542 RepID=UPI0035DDC4DC
MAKYKKAKPGATDGDAQWVVRNICPDGLRLRDVRLSKEGAKWRAVVEGHDHISATGRTVEVAVDAAVAMMAVEIEASTPETQEGSALTLPAMGEPVADTQEAEEAGITSDPVADEPVEADESPEVSVQSEPVEVTRLHLAEKILEAFRNSGSVTTVFTGTPKKDVAGREAAKGSAQKVIAESLAAVRAALVNAHNAGPDIPNDMLVRVAEGAERLIGNHASIVEKSCGLLRGSDSANLRKQLVTRVGKLRAAAEMLDDSAA